VNDVYKKYSGSHNRPYVINYFLYDGLFQCYFALEKIHDDCEIKFKHWTIHNDEICFARLGSDWNRTNEKGFILSGYFKMDTNMSEDQIRRYLMACKEYGYVNKNFGFERFINSRQYIWNLANVNLTQWYFWLTMVRYIYEHDHIPMAILDLMDAGFQFPIAVAIAHLEIGHNTGHGIYNKSNYRSKWGEDKNTSGLDLWGGWKEIRELRNRWSERVDVVEHEYIRQGDKVDPNMIISAAIKTRRFLDQKRKLCRETGLNERFGLHTAIIKQPVEKQEYDYGFDYGDYDSLINLNPYERMV
jgi:hypothetical protein